MIGSNIVIVIGAALALAAGGCKRNDAERAAPQEAGEPGTPATKTPDSPDVAAPAARSTDQVLATYERARALLAGDQTSGLAEAAGELERAATAAAAAASPEAAAHHTALASAAKDLGTAADLDAARLAFGEVSRHVVALLVADKTLAEGKHIFECPMAKGYQKWVQPTAKLENPYMGQRMLSCGSASTWQ